MHAHEEERKMLERILHTASDAIICVDGSKKVLFINQKGEELTGWKSEEVVGRSFCREVGQIRDSRGHLLCNFNCALEMACQAKDKTSVSEGLLLKKDGKQIWVECRYSAVTDDAGNLGFGVLTVRDISNLKRAERLRLQLTSNIVHELKTPLTYIRGYVDLLLREQMGPVASDQRRALEVMRDSVFRLLTLIDNLLEVARIEEGRFYLRFGAVSMAHILEKSVNLARSEAFRKGIELKTNISSDGIEIYADGKRLEEVLMNLLSNALKYTSSGGRVEAGFVEEGDEVYLYVSDTGVGIPTDHLANVFSRFAQLEETDGSRSGEGAGLGLNIVKRIVEAHGGKVSVDSVVGKGSTFYVRIPKRAIQTRD